MARKTKIQMASASMVQISDNCVVGTTLSQAREKLGMEVAYISEFVADRAVFRVVSAPGLEALIQPSQSMDLREVYCKHIIDGKLPRLMADTSVHKIAADLPITQMIPIASHVSVPVHRDDGSVFGMFCLLNRAPMPHLSERDLDFIEAQARIVASHLTAPTQMPTPMPVPQMPPEAGAHRG